MRYPLDPELAGLARQKMPNSRKLLPVVNAVVGLAKGRCRSDGRVTVGRHSTPGYNGGTLETLVLEPAGSSGPLPCLVLFHGGGFMLKGSDAHYQLARRYAEEFPCRVVSPDYRLAPKHPYPVPVEDCYQTYLWALDNAAALGIDPDRVVVSGDSAGGALALGAVLMARDRGVRLPQGLLLVYPVTDRRMETASMKTYTDTPMWDANLSRMMWEVYLGDGAPADPAYASPAEAASLAGLPPAYVEVAQFDCLRDEGVALAHRLREEGAGAELYEVPGGCHGFETALESRMLRGCMDRRLAWLRAVTGGACAGK